MLFVYINNTVNDATPFLLFLQDKFRVQMFKSSRVFTELDRDLVEISSEQ